MISRVRISGYKSLQSVEVDLGRLSIIFGPNAAGKSNLFDALSLLSRMVTNRTLRDAFDDHRGAPLEAFFQGEAGIEALLRSPSAKFTIEVDVEISETVTASVERQIQEMRKGLTPDSGAVTKKTRVLERHLRYTLSVEILTDSGYLRVTNERLAALTSDGQETRSRMPFVETEGSHVKVRLEGQGHPTHYDVGLDHTLVSTPLYPPHYPHITLFREELSRWRFYYLEPKRLMRSDNALQEAQFLDPTGANLAAFFNSLQIHNGRQFKAVNQALPSLLPRVERLEVERTKTGELQIRVYEGGVAFPASIVSEGTLRILGLLAITSSLTPATVVGYEEPENGVHPQRLKLIADAFSNAAASTDTQFLINTHSSDFPDYFLDAALIVCRRSSTATRFERLGSAGLFQRDAIVDGLTEVHELPTTLSDRIRRGDFSE